jgi:hypothetical protein
MQPEKKKPSDTWIHSFWTRELLDAIKQLKDSEAPVSHALSLEQALLLLGARALRFYSMDSSVTVHWMDYTSVLRASRVQLTYRAITIVVAISFIPLSSLVADPTTCCTGNPGAECKSTSKPEKTGYVQFLSTWSMMPIFSLANHV